MKAVNLIPAEDRRGAGGAAGRSGGAVYVLLGALGVVVLLVGALTLSGRAVRDERSRLAHVERDATAAEARAQSLKGYADFAALSQKRAATVRSIADSRFDWSFTLHEIARTIPRDVALTSLTGTVAPGVALQGASAGSTLRGALPTPAVELAGCTTSQANVARMMSAMRRVAGVRRVSLQSSTKPGGGGASGGAGGGCTNTTKRDPQFSMVIFFDAKPAPAASPGTAPAQTASTPTPAPEATK